MNSEALFGLINNTALLLALGLLYDLASSGSLSKLLKKPVIGLFIGVIGLAVMATPWLLVSGVRFDTRSILLGISGLFFGLTPTAIAAVITVLFRWKLGGPGAPVGIFFIISSALIGLLWRKLRPKNAEMKASELYLFGLTIHLVIVASMLWLPENVKTYAMQVISIPILIVFPIGTLLLGLLLKRQRTRLRLTSELETERKLFSNIASTSPVGITMCDRSGNITYANDMAVKILGLKKNQVLSRAFNSPKWKITDINGNQLPDDKLPFSIVRNTGKPLYDAQHYIQWPNGKKVLLSVSGAALLDLAGEVSEVICIIEDITQRKAAQDRIDKLNRIHRIQSNVNQAIIRSNNITEVLDQACRIAVEDGGFARTSFMKLNDSGNITPIAINNDNSPLPCQIKNGKQISNTCPAIDAIKKSARSIVTGSTLCKNSSQGYACAAFPIIVNNEAVAAMCLYATQENYFDDKEELQLLEKLASDISFAWEFHNQQTLRKQAEYNLVESEVRYRSLFEKNHAIMLLIDPADGQIMDANSAACKYYGWTAQQLRNMKISDINTLSPDQVKEEMELAKQQRRSHFIFKHRTAEGKIRDVEVYCGPIVYKDKEMLYSIVHDITERISIEQQRDHMENQLRQSQKMEAVGRLAGGVAHDINNMLTVIIGYAENSMSNLPTGSEAYQAIGEIKNAANRSARLTQQLLAFSRKQVIKPQTVNLNEVVQHHSNMLIRLIGENITLHNNLAEDLWNVHIDPSQIDQILTNLAVNARDAISGHGNISISTANIVIDESFNINKLEAAPGEYVTLSVSDSGSGIPDEELEHIFEPFYTTKPEGEGTGLGLSTVYGIVKQNGGTIDAYRNPEKGMTFDIYLSRSKKMIDKVKEPVPSAPQKGKHTILVAEDERQILNLSKTILEHYGYTVLTASGAREAIELATRSTCAIDLLLTDVVMPTMNGKQLQKEIQQIHPEIKSLFMSGHTANVIEKHGVLDHEISFIHKPFSMEELARKVHEVLQGSQVDQSEKTPEVANQ